MRLPSKCFNPRVREDATRRRVTIVHTRTCFNPRVREDATMINQNWTTTGARFNPRVREDATFDLVQLPAITNEFQSTRP